MDIRKESILDQPKMDMDSVVWKRTEDGEYVLTDEAKDKINAVIGYMMSDDKAFRLP